MRIRSTARIFLAALLICGALAAGGKVHAQEPGDPMQVSGEALGDLSWGECVSLTLRHNQDLKVAATRLEEAEGAKLEFRSRALPRAQMTAITFPPLVLMDVRQAVYDHRVVLGWQASKLSEQVARLNYRLQSNEVMTALRVAYLNLLAVQEQARLTASLQKFVQSRLENAQSMFDTGNLRKSEVEQIQVRLSLVRDALIQISEEEDRARTGLLEVMGTGLQVGALSDGFEELPDGEVDSAQVLDAAYRSLPELQLLDVLAEGSRFQARIARAEKYANVYLFGRAEFSPGLEDLGLADSNRAENSVTNTAVGAAGALTGAGTTPDDETEVDPTTDATGLGNVDNTQVGADDDDEFEKSRGLFGLTMRWDVFDGGSSEGKALQQDANAARQLVTADQLRRALPGQVAEANENLESARRILESIAAMPTFEETLAMAEDEYRGDRAGHNETLAFALDGFQLHSAAIREKYRANLAMTILRRMSGQLLSFAGESAN